MERSIDKWMPPPQIPPTITTNPPTLAEYYKCRYPNYHYAAHIQQIVNVLEELKPKDALILNIPPRHGKSDTVAAFLEWRLGIDSVETVMYASYTASLAYKRSRIIRNEIATGRAFRSKFTHTKLTGDAKAVTFWELLQGGGFIASGVGGSITGMGASLAVIDDPLKGRKEAESQLVRQNVIDWFTSDLLTRLTPNANLVVIQTRWHPNDLTGWLLEQIAKEENFAGFNWKKLIMPAISEGRALWPERFNLEWLEQRKKANEYDFASLYQQDPIPRGGAVFRDAHYYSELPKEGFKKAIAVDLAYTSKKHADYTVILSGLAKGGKLYVTDMQRVQEQISVVTVMLKQRQHEERATVHTRIGGQEKAVVEFLEREGLSIDSQPTEGDKFSNAQPVATAWNRGDILLCESAAWVGELLNEVLNFTGVEDKHDDIVDTLVTLWKALIGMPQTPTYQETLQALQVLNRQN